MLPTFTMPTFRDVIMLILIGVFAAGGQIGLTFAYQKAPASEVSIYQYSGVVFTALLSYLIFHETLTATSIIGAIVILAASVALSILLSRTLSSPIHDLILAMRSFEKTADNFTYEPVSGVREVQNLSASFGHMVRKIQQLMVTVRSEEVNLRKTELKALQAQINPHFLYNTLDCISWMCEQGKNAVAVTMV